MPSLSRRPLRTPALIVICAFVLLSTLAASARAAVQPSYDHPKFVDLWKQATRPAGATITEYPDFTLVKSKDGLTLYYFTKPNHFAHPGTVKRSLKQNSDGSWSHSIDAASFVAKRNDPNFLRWLEQFEELNRRMQKAIEEDYGKPL